MVDTILSELENTHNCKDDIASMLCYRYKAVLYKKFYSDEIRHYMFLIAEDHLLMEFGDKRLDKALEDPDYIERMQNIFAQMKVYRRY